MQSELFTWALSLGLVAIALAGLAAILAGLVALILYAAGSLGNRISDSKPAHIFQPLPEPEISPPPQKHKKRRRKPL